MIQYIVLIGIIVILIVVCTLCGRESYSKYPSVGVVTMTRDPLYFDFWLNYYFNHLKINKLYLRVENTPNLRQLINQSPYKDKIEIETSANVNNFNTYDTQQERQNKWVKHAINQGKQDRIDFLLHIDDDELFMLHSKFKHIQDFFYTLPDDSENIKFKNLEAVYPKDGVCFTTTRFVECGKGNCKSYVNGKSAGQITYRLKPNGPHSFNGKTMTIPIKDACILHFESCNFERWYSKFKNMSNIDKKTYNKIPFTYYKQSLDFIKNCKGGKCKEKARKFWKKQKVDPYHTSKNLKEFRRHVSN